MDRTHGPLADAGPLAYMGEDGAFPLEIRRCSDFLLVATLEAGEERYGRLFAASPEMLDIIEAAIPHLERQQQALQNLTRPVPGLQLAREHVAALAERAERLGELVARARMVVAAARGGE